MKNLHSYIFILLFFIGAVQSCDNKSKESKSTLEKENVVIIEAENTKSAAEELTTNQNSAKETYAIVEQNGWLTFDVNFPVAGRYKVQVKASVLGNPAQVWIEDYIDNKDGRIYNVTGNIDIVPENKPLTIYEKIGSPFNSGVHKMKLHTNNPVNIDWIKFTLIEKDIETPKSLTQNMEGDEWVVTWSDEFDGKEIDTTKWTYDLGNWGWGNYELQYYTRNRSKNARIEDGNLIIEAHKNDMGEKWTSARLTTRWKVSFLYGKIEFRAKVPAEKGNWAAGWTLGDDYVDELSWPYCGEIDIMESVGYEMDNETGNGIAHASAHSGAYYFKLGNQPTATTEVKNMNNEYHTYAVEWYPERIDMLVDGEVYFTYDDTTTELAWPFAKPHNIILNLAMGGGWGGAQGMDPNVTSQKMIIDYVRVYERK